MRSLPRSHQLARTCRRTKLNGLARGISRLVLAPILGRASRSRPLNIRQSQFPRGFFSSRDKQKEAFGKSSLVVAPTALLLGGLLIYSLYPGDELRRARLARRGEKDVGDTKDGPQPQCEKTAWSSFASRFEDFSNVTDIEWSTFSDRIVDLILPDWSKALPGQIRKLQHELSMADGSLASEIWQEAHDPFTHPEIQYSAKVRVSDELCDEEKEFLARRKKVATAALAKYLGLNEKDIHPDDVPTIAMCGSGGGLRALVAGTGSLLATQEDGLFDCVTYTSGVSGSCWLQSLFHSTLTDRRLDRLVDHLKARIGIHIAYPPAAFSSVTTSPTNKLLLSSLVEKLKGDPKADFGLVDVYGILLAARLLVPKGELGIDERDFKLSNQRQYIKYGQHPMPIYTAVRHEIPNLASDMSKSSIASQEKAKEIAKQEAWFQWFELTPYEFFCEEFNAGIPTWALGRRFDNGEDVPPEGNGFHLPELRMPIMMGIFGSAFCATLSHYYREIRPLVKSLTGFATLDEMIYGYNEDLEKVHPIDPAQIPNFTYNMEGKLRFTTPTTIYNNEYIQLMDAGMSNNLPIYPLLRPGRDVDVIVAFDASADVKTDNWLSVTDGYARQRGVKGWPVGAGWPKGTDSTQKIEQQLDAAQANSAAEAEAKMRQAQQNKEASEQANPKKGPVNDPAEQSDKARHDIAHPEDSDLGYCTVWVGTTEERSSEPPPPTTRAVTDDTAWRLTEASAGLTVVYLPFLANPKVGGVNPADSDYMSTWNFVYTPEQIDKVVALARANYDEGRDRIRRTVRAVYERKKRVREESESANARERYRRLVRLGIADKLGEGDHFS
ncbi:FabD/lysophospholipase-like protein [Hypoxylon cercidicola]|nr:FabD/lysophospholipase-like protein [Hypoxylon cercidicola]